MEKDRKIKILQDLVKIKSINANEEEVAVYLQNIFEEYKIETELVEYDENRSSLVATFGKSENKVLGISGHLDVVSAGDDSEWSYPPYSGEIVDGIMYGRGTSDMKSGVAALAIAMCEFSEENPDFNGKIKFMGTVGEEVGELGAMQLTEKGYADDLDALVIGEPTGPQITYAHMGSMNYTVKSFGKSAHSSMPQEGINAINNLNSFISLANNKMNEITESYENEILGRTIHNITIIKGGDQVNSIPAYAELQGNIRSIPEFSNDKIEGALQGIINELDKVQDGRLELILDFNKIPVESKKDSEIIRAIQKSTDKELALGGISPTTDAAEFTKSKKDFDVVIFGPGVPTTPHKVDEHVYIDNYLDFIELYKKMMENYFVS